jgi:hypothetical protein
MRDPGSFLHAFTAHRGERDRQIRDCIDRGLCDFPAMVKVMYKDVDPRLHEPAAMSVLAHLQHMQASNRVSCDGEAAMTSVYRRG